MFYETYCDFDKDFFYHTEFCRPSDGVLEANISSFEIHSNKQCTFNKLIRILKFDRN